MIEHNLFINKLKQVAARFAKIQHEEFGDGFPGGKPKMAMVLVFHTYYSALLTYMENCKGNYSDNAKSEIIKKIDFLLMVYNMPESDWELFLANKLKSIPLNPHKIPFNSEGKEQVEFLNINDIKSFIPE